MSNSEIRRNLGFGLPHGENKLADVKSSVRRVEPSFWDEFSWLEDEAKSKDLSVMRFFDWSPPITANAQIKTWRVVRPTIEPVDGWPPSIVSSDSCCMQQDIFNNRYADMLARVENYLKQDEEKPIDVMAITRQMCK